MGGGQGAAVGRLVDGHQLVRHLAVVGDEDLARVPPPLGGDGGAQEPHQPAQEPHLRRASMRGKVAACEAWRAAAGATEEARRAACGRYHDEEELLGTSVHGRMTKT